MTVYTEPTVFDALSPSERMRSVTIRLPEWNARAFAEYATKKRKPSMVAADKARYHPLRRTRCRWESYNLLSGF